MKNLWKQVKTIPEIDIEKLEKTLIFIRNNLCISGVRFEYKKIAVKATIERDGKHIPIEFKELKFKGNFETFLMKILKRKIPVLSGKIFVDGIEWIC